VAGLRVIEGGRAAARPDAPGSKGGLPSGLLAELYKKHAAQVFGRCRFLLRDEHQARDALQEVFVKALRSLDEFRSDASPSTWLLKIATNHCLNELRAKKAAFREQLEVMQKERRQETEPPERRELVRMLLGAVPLETQEVAVIYYVDELTQAEIAQALGRSLPTVRKRLREFIAAARETLRTALPGLELPEGDEP
jgi:RNA polymerase sigma factor (sigma-70 family)